MRAVDFFCGAGGLTCGLLQAGVQVIAGVDVCEEYRTTYQANNHVPLLSKSITDISDDDVYDILPDINTADDILFCGCAPCQPFSQQRNSPTEHKDRNLLLTFGSIIAQYRPSYIMIENVPGIARRGKDIFCAFLDLLHGNGYKYKYAVLNAKDFGVPQNRKRLVLIGSRIRVPRLPEPTHGTELNPYRTVADAISHYPRIAAGETSNTIANHKAARLSPINLKRIQVTRQNGGSRTEWPQELILNCHKGAMTGHTDVYGRMAWESVSPTLTSKCFSLSNGRFGHPEQDRAISFREAAALQSFPDNYTFYGESKETLGRQIGNAVPVLLARAIGETLLEMERSDA